MKIVLFIIISILLLPSIYSQDRLNIVLTVDDVIPYSLENSNLVLENDTIQLQYKMGRFLVTETDLVKLKSAGKLKEVSLNINYTTFCPVQEHYTYSIYLKSDLLLQDYFLLKIYNYSSYPKVFGKKAGYIFGYESPLGFIGLPSKNKMKRNPCN